DLDLEFSRFASGLDYLIASARQCLLNQFADLSVCANQNNFHKKTPFCLLRACWSFDRFATSIICQWTNLFRCAVYEAPFQASPCGPAVSRLASHKLWINCVCRACDRPIGSFVSK